MGMRLQAFKEFVHKRQCVETGMGCVDQLDPPKREIKSEFLPAHLELHFETLFQQLRNGQHVGDCICPHHRFVMSYLAKLDIVRCGPKARPAWVVAAKPWQH